MNLTTDPFAAVDKLVLGEKARGGPGSRGKASLLLALLIVPVLGLTVAGGMHGMGMGTRGHKVAMDWQHSLQNNLDEFGDTSYVGDTPKTRKMFRKTLTQFYRRAQFYPSNENIGAYNSIASIASPATLCQAGFPYSLKFRSD